MKNPIWNSIKFRIFAITLTAGFAITLTVTLIHYFDISALRDHIITSVIDNETSSQKQHIKSQTEMVLATINALYETMGDTAESRELSAKVLRSMRSNSDYFWAYTLDGVCVVGANAAEENQNVIDWRDKSGELAIRTIIKNGLKSGGDFTDFWYPQIMSSGSMTTDQHAKTAYSVSFSPFGWIIGTGFYNDKVDTSINLIVSYIDGTIRDNILRMILIIFMSILVLTSIIFIDNASALLSIELISEQMLDIKMGIADFTKPITIKTRNEIQEIVDSY
jgi:methyl-accepting chemotaxis protein